MVEAHYRSDLDDTDQPYSLWLPRDYDPKKKWPLVVTLHGLGGGYKIGGVPREIEDCVVVAPDGRGNTDYKLWGELDVVRVVEEARKSWSIDPDRVYMYGVSMGGSGSWQVGVHFPDLFAALGPICGNADHRVWEKLWNWGEVHPNWMSPRKAWVEATESPAFFAENLINLPSWCIHGDKDNVVPCDHSRSMAAELEKAGAECHYVEVPGAGHGVPGGTLPPLLNWMKDQRRNPWPPHVIFKTAWRRHPGAYWVRVHRFLRAFAFARIEAEAVDKTHFTVKTDNLEEFSLHLVPPLAEKGKPVRVSIDGRQDFEGPVPPDGWLRLRLVDGTWQPSTEPAGLHKTPELEGPVQHAFMSSFLIVHGTQGDDAAEEASRAKRVAADEARILADRWNRWARGKCRAKADRDVTPDDIRDCNLILVGDPATNSLVPKVMPGLPIRIEGDTIVFGDRTFKGDDLGLKLVYPNPLNPQRYVALFTGTTWRGVYQIVGRFGNWFDWGILDGWHWSDFAVFDDHSYSPETFLAIGYFDNDWKLSPGWYVAGNDEMRMARPARKTPTLRRAPTDAGEFYLSDLDPAGVNIEKGAVGRDRSFSAFPLTLGGRTYPRGLGVHPNCDLAFDLDGRFPTFEAVVGSDLEDEPGVSEARDKAESFEFLVVGDGRTIYQTGRMRWNSEPRHIYVPIEGVRRLELKIQRRSGPRWLSGPVDWAIARVGEPIHNSVAVRPKAEGPEKLAESASLDGAWKLAGFEVGAGIGLDAHRGAPEAQGGAVQAQVPGSVYAAAPEARDAARREWWLWRDFDVPAGWAGRSVWIDLDGAAYQADGWVNGRWVGRTVGPFVSGHFDATKAVKIGGKNVLAIRVTASPADWAKGEGPFVPEPASKLVTSHELAREGYPLLGIWQPVRLRSAGPCVLRDLQAETLSATDKGARLRLQAEVENVVRDKLEGEVAFSVGGEGFDFPPNQLPAKFSIDGGKTARVELDVDLSDDPWRWMPRELGKQWLHRLTASVKLDGGAVSDEASVRFGIRAASLDASAGSARLAINGQPLDIHGCVWLPADALLRLDSARYERLLACARDCGFNTLRVWGGGLAETDLFYDLCDRLGFLVLQEFPLTREGSDQPVDDFLANAAATIRRLRRHPSLVAWCVGGAAEPDALPNPRLTAELISLCGDLDPGRRLIADSPRTGLAQVWSTRADPATRRTYWTGATLRYAPGVASPSAAATLGRDLRWPAAGAWARDGAALAAAAYGPSQSAREFILKAQAAQAAAIQRALERRRLEPASDVLWQLNEPTPSSSPALIDAAGVPKPACYALRRAQSPIAVFADFAREAPQTLAVGERLLAEVCAENKLAALDGATVGAALLDRSLRHLADWRERVDAERGVLARPVLIDWTPDASLAGDVVFLHLRLADEAGRPLASNLYWFGIVAPAKAPARLRVAWMTGRPQGLLADAAFLAAAGIEVKKPDAELFGPQTEGQKTQGPLAGYDAIVVDAATVLDEYLDQDLALVAKAVEGGCGLLVVGQDETLADSSLGPILPTGSPDAVPTGLARRPVAADPLHPAISRVSFEDCPPLARRGAVEVRSVGGASLPRVLPVGGASLPRVLVQLDATHPLLVETRYGGGRVLALLTHGDELASWAGSRRLWAGILGYLGRLPYPEMTDMVDAALPAPLRAMSDLGPARLDAAAREQDGAVVVTLTNSSPVLALLAHVEAVPSADAPAAGLCPLTFSDNYASLLPGESCALRIEAVPGAQAGAWTLAVRGWNLEPQVLDKRLVLEDGRLRLRGR